MVRLALLTVLLLALLPAQAQAQGVFFGPFQPPQEDYGPGVTVEGAGLARVIAPAKLTEDSVREAIDAARPRAVTRAMADARRRAEAIASALGLSLGSAEAVELGGAGFPEREPCRRSRRTGELRCRVPGFTTAAATMTYAIVGGAESSEGAREVSASAVGSAPAEPKRQTSPAIRHALFAARALATPEAALAARANAELASQGSGLALGPLVSIVEQQSLYGYQPILGAVGPGLYCRSFRRNIVRRDPETGIRRVVGRRRVRRCFAPRSFQVSLEATYLAQGS
jgi:Protein of unknown function (DUF541)